MDYQAPAASKSATYRYLASMMSGEGYVIAMTTLDELSGCRDPPSSHSRTLYHNLKTPTLFTFKNHPLIVLEMTGMFVIVYVYYCFIVLLC